MFEELKQKQSVMWGCGDFDRITETLVPLRTPLDTVDDERVEQLHESRLASMEPYRGENGVSQPRPYVLILGTRRT